MRTTRPISTITYNSKQFLIDKLDSLIYLREISYYEFITHLPDTDGKKIHIHLYVEPNKSIDLMDFADKFNEYDPLHPDLPLKPQKFVFSEYGNWYWYALHDKSYLRSKLMERNLHYEDKDIVCSDRDYHENLVMTHPLINYCSMSDSATRDYVLSCVFNGISLTAMLSSGLIGLGKTQQAITLYRALESTSCYCPVVDLPFNNDQQKMKDELFD